MKKYLSKMKLIFDEDKEFSNLLDLKNFDYKHYIFLNTHSYISSLKDLIFMKSILNSNTIFADGVGISIILRFLFRKKKIKRITGYEFFEKLLNKIDTSINSPKIYFLGGSEVNLKKIKELIILKYKNIDKTNIGFYSPPYGKDFKFRDPEIINNINSFNPDIIFVGLGAPKQEKWVYLNKKYIKCKKYISIGAAFNFFTNLEIRAPKLLQEIGLEWLFRLFLNPKKIYKRVFISGSIYIFLFFLEQVFKKEIYSLNKKIINIKLIKNFNNFNWKSSFILSALNLASISYLYKSEIINSKKLFFWGDGIAQRLIVKENPKIPGRKLLDLIKIDKKIQNIHVIGNLTKKSEEYLEKKYDKEIKNTKLPYGPLNNILKALPNIYENEFVFLTLPTPKQEQVALHLSKKYDNLKIICIGGGLAIASGEEKSVPKMFDYLGMEWLWRLRYETMRRIKRLFSSLFWSGKYFIYGKYFKKISIKKII